MLSYKIGNNKTFLYYFDINTFIAAIFKKII